MIRLADFESPFNLVEVGDCAEILDRLRKPINADSRRSRHGDVPYYGANGPVGFIDEWIFNEELVLVAEDGGFFYDPIKPISYRISGKAWVNNHAHVLRAKESVDVDWLNYAISYQDVTSLVKGATLKKLNQQDLKRIRIPLPEISEQRRIVARIKECLDRVEEIECLTNDIELEADCLPQAFRFDLWNECLSRHPLLELGSLVSAAKNGLYKPREHHGSGSILLRMFNINGAQFDTTRLERLTVTEREADDYAIRNGDIIVSRVNSRELVGKSTVVTGVNEAAVYEAMLIRLRTDATKALPDVLAWMINAPQFLHALRMRAKHAIGQSSINQQDLLSSCLPLPPMDEQQKLAERFADLGELATCLRDESRAQRRSTNGLREAILRKAFSGEL
jgi:type I restriction enzyme S subunit